MVCLLVRLTPRGGRNAIDGWARDEAGQLYLKARVAAPPVGGAANAALEQLIAKRFRRPARSVRIISGDHSRVKRVEIDGLDQDDVAKVLGLPE